MRIICQFLAHTSFATILHFKKISVNLIKELLANFASVHQIQTGFVLNQVQRGIANFYPICVLQFAPFFLNENQPSLKFFQHFKNFPHF